MASEVLQVMKDIEANEGKVIINNNTSIIFIFIDLIFALFIISLFLSFSYFIYYSFVFIYY